MVSHRYGFAMFCAGVSIGMACGYALHPHPVLAVLGPLLLLLAAWLARRNG